MAVSPEQVKKEDLPLFPVSNMDASTGFYPRELEAQGNASNRSPEGTQYQPSADHLSKANMMGSYGGRETARSALYGNPTASFYSGATLKQPRMPMYMHPSGQFAIPSTFSSAGMFPGVMNPMIVAPSSAIAPQMLSMPPQLNSYPMVPSHMAASPMPYSTVFGNAGSSEPIRPGRTLGNEEKVRFPMYEPGQLEESQSAAHIKYNPRTNTVVHAPYYAMGGNLRTFGGNYAVAHSPEQAHPLLASSPGLEGYYEGLVPNAAAHRHPPMMLVPQYPIPDPSVNPLYSSPTGGYYAPAPASLPYPVAPNYSSNASSVPSGQMGVPALVTVVDGQAYAQILPVNPSSAPMNQLTGPTFPPPTVPAGTPENIAELNRRGYNVNLQPSTGSAFPPSEHLFYNQYMRADPHNTSLYAKNISMKDEAAITQHLNGIKPQNAMREYVVEKSLFVTQQNLEKNTLIQREINLISIHKNPSVLYMEDFLIPEECQYIISLCDGRLIPSKTSKGLESDLQENFVSSDSSNRTSYNVRLLPAETPTIETIERRVAAVAQMDVSHLEPLVVVKYEEGQFFKEHHDGKFRPVTVLIYLNEVEQGGETQFPRLGLKILPSWGGALTWKNCGEDGEADLNVLHEALPPIKGVKWAVNCFFNSQVVREIAEGAA